MTNRIIIILSILSIVFYSRCSEEQLPEEIFPECIGTSNIEFRTCMDINTPIVTCEPVDLGDTEIHKDNLRFMNFYCYQPGSVIEWINNNGEIVSSIVFSNKFYEIVTRTDGNNICITDSTARSRYCYISQNIETLLFFDDLNSSIKISVSTTPDVLSISNTELIFDQLEIIRSNPPSMSIGAIEFSYVLPPASATIFRSPYEEFFESIKFNGRMYNNVYSINTEGFSRPTFKYYLNRNDGFVAFQDESNRLWTINEN